MSTASKRNILCEHSLCASSKDGNNFCDSGFHAFKNGEWCVYFFILAKTEKDLAAAGSIWEQAEIRRSVSFSLFNVEIHRDPGSAPAFFPWEWLPEKAFGGVLQNLPPLFLQLSGEANKKGEPLRGIWKGRHPTQGIPPAERAACDLELGGCQPQFSSFARTVTMCIHQSRHLERKNASLHIWPREKSRLWLGTAGETKR